MSHNPKYLLVTQAIYSSASATKNFSFNHRSFLPISSTRKGSRNWNSRMTFSLRHPISLQRSCRHSILRGIPMMLRRMTRFWSFGRRSWARGQVWKRVLCCHSLTWIETVSTPIVRQNLLQINIRRKGSRVRAPVQRSRTPSSRISEPDWELNITRHKILHCLRESFLGSRTSSLRRSVSSSDTNNKSLSNIRKTTCLILGPVLRWIASNKKRNFRSLGRETLGPQSCVHSGQNLARILIISI